MSQPRVQQLLAEGARQGLLSYRALNDLLGDLQLDEDDAETLLETLESRGIEVIEDAPDEPPAPKAAKPRRKAKVAAIPGALDGNDDLDEALASLQELLSQIEIPAESDGKRAASDAVEDLEGAVVEDALKQYLGRMGDVALLEPAEEKRLALLARNGSPAEQARARQQLVEANLRLVVYLARRASNRTTLPMLDLVQEGNIGLVGAVNRYDPARHHKLSTYATWYIRHALNRAIAEHARSMRLPAHLSEAIQTLQRLSRELTQTLNRTPTRQELAQASGLTMVQVEEALRSGEQPLSLEAPVGEEEDLELGETLSDSDDDASIEALSRSELRQELTRAMQGLSERERAIITMRFGVGQYAESGARSVEQIAGEMKLSTDRVRQLEVRALRKLRRRSRAAALSEFVSGGED